MRTREHVFFEDMRTWEHVVFEKTEEQKNRFFKNRRMGICRRVWHPCHTHTDMSIQADWVVAITLTIWVYSRLSGYGRDAIPSYNIWTFYSFTFLLLNSLFTLLLFYSFTFIPWHGMAVRWHGMCIRWHGTDIRWHGTEIYVKIKI